MVYRLLRLNLTSIHFVSTVTVVDSNPSVKSPLIRPNLEWQGSFDKFESARWHFVGGSRYSIIAWYIVRSVDTKGHFLQICFIYRAFSLKYEALLRHTWPFPLQQNTTHSKNPGRVAKAIKRPRTRSTAARQVSNAHERDLVTNQNV